MGERALLTALRLSLTSRWQRLRREASAHPALVVSLLVASAAAVLILLSSARAPAIRDALVWTTQNEFLVGLAASLYAVLFVTRKRSHLRRERSDSWLLPTPISARAFALTCALRIGAALSIQFFACVAVLLAIAIVNAHPSSALWLVDGALAVGMSLGALLGTVWPLKNEANQNEDSRFIRRTRATAMTPSLSGLSHWPISRAIAWHRPENARVLFIIAALSVPVGASALVGVGILAVWTLASYLLALVRAVPVVAREASNWLRPTSLPFAAFARSIAVRALAHQAIGTAFLGGVFFALGAHFVDVLYFSCLWLGMAAMVAMIAIRQSYLALPSLGRAILSILIVLMTESRLRGVGLPLALAVAAFHLRGQRERA
jgi:hypothetical protein